MDSLTHTLLGACLGEAIAGKKMGKKAMLFGILANNLPDADMIANLWNSEAHSLLTHRGITHSILFALLATIGLSVLFQRWFKRYGLTPKEWITLMGSGLFLHILLDACTAYGTGWFEPFSSYRVSFNTLFILDPFFSLPMLLGTLLLLVLRNDRYKLRKIVQLSSLALSTLYLLITAGIKLHVNNIIRADLEAKHLPAGNFFSTPAPLNNLLWYSAAMDGEDLYTGYYSIFDQRPQLTWTAFKRHDSLLAAYRYESDVQDLIQFSKGLYYLSHIDSGVQFSDIRFGQFIGTDTADHGFVFNFDILARKNQAPNVQQSAFKDFSKKDMNRLLERVKGE